MRHFILIAASALALGACRNNDQADNNMNLDENLTAENIVSNDVTAIDAVTGDAANMAADVNYVTLNELSNNGATANDSAPAPAKLKPGAAESATNAE